MKNCDICGNFIPVSYSELITRLSAKDEQIENLKRKSDRLREENEELKQIIKTLKNDSLKSGIQKFNDEGLSYLMAIQKLNNGGLSHIMDMLT